MLQRLAQGSSGDPGHLVDLGDRYFQDGNSALAVQTWKRILVVVQPRAKALAALGDVYLEHDLTPDALAAYKEAVALEPANLVFKKALAAALERTRAYREASTLYEEIVAKAKEKGDKALARECRTRIVALWGLERILEQQLPALKTAFSANPPDVEAGRMLAEAELRLRRLPDAEATLRRVVEVAPGDGDSATSRSERVLVQENKIADAIAVLAKLTEVDPKRARELYERMAQYALQIYKDDDAIKYAARAVELNPDDAEGHRRLGEMYRSKQDADHATAEFRAAITKNDRLFIVYLELADLLRAKGKTTRPSRLFRRVVRSSPRRRPREERGEPLDGDQSRQGDARVARAGSPAAGHRRAAEAHLPAFARGALSRSHLRARPARPSRKPGRRERGEGGAGPHQGARAVKPPLLDALADQDS